MHRKRNDSYRRLKELKPYLIFGAVVLVLAVLAGIGGYYTITGLVVYDNFVFINATYNSSTNISLTNVPASFGLNGIANGNVKVYANNELVLDSSLLLNESFTDYCLGNCSSSGEINLTIEIINGSLYLEGLNSRIKAVNNIPNWSSNIERFTVMINSNLTIDLNDYFSDFDNDTLTYLATASTKFEITISGSLMTIKPISNESSGEDITLIATDMRDSLRKTVRIQSDFIDAIEQEVANSPVSLEREVVEGLEFSDEVRIIIPVRNKQIGLTPKEDEFAISGYDYSELENYSQLNVMAVKITRSGLEKLKKNKDVLGIFTDKKLNISISDALAIIKAPEASQLSSGNVGVCLLDTGVNGNFSFGYNFVNKSANVSDDNGHGTLVATILKETAPNVNIIPVKVCNEKGECLSSNVLAGLNYCLENKALYNISAVSGSFGDHGEYTNLNCPSDFGDTFDVLDLNNIASVFAAGNDAYRNGVNFPACDINVIAAGASDKRDGIALFSNLVDSLLLAPGENLNVSGQLVSGTSFSTAFVAGGAAMLKSLNNSLNTAAIKATFFTTGKQIGNYTRIDLLASLQNISPPATEISRYCTSDGNCLVQSEKDLLYPCYINESIIICPALNDDGIKAFRRSLSGNERDIFLKDGIPLRNINQSQITINSFDAGNNITNSTTINGGYYLDPLLSYWINIEPAKPLYVEIGFG